MAKQDKKESKPEAKLTPSVKREEYIVLYTYNFGTGEIPAGKTVKMSEKAAEHYLDKGLIKKSK